MPWPNRIRDGRYTFGGQGEQLALTEPARGNAIHGLVRWAIWSVLEQAEETVTHGYRLHPQQDWDWCLDLSVTYTLTAPGLIVTPRARNVGTGAAPFGLGTHPYLSVGEDCNDEVRLVRPAAAHLEVDERLLPIRLKAVEGSDLDFRRPRRLGALVLDTAFTDVVADADGRWRVSLAHPGTGRAVTLWADASAYQWLQVFRATHFPSSPGVRAESRNRGGADYLPPGRFQLRR
jgi:aldose 1-epimerase